MNVRYQSAYDDGFREGYQLGYRRGQSRARKQLQELGIVTVSDKQWESFGHSIGSAYYFWLGKAKA